MGILPEGSALSTPRIRGRLPFTDWGRTPLGRGESAPWPEDGRNYCALSNHVERGHPYPTLTRRAQFLVEHPWFVEAGSFVVRAKLSAGQRPGSVTVYTAASG
jgi:nitrate reductase alpha subunit